MTPITDSEREDFARKINSDQLSLEDKAYHLTETMKSLGIPTANQEKPKTPTEIREQRVIGKEDLEKLVKESLTTDDEQHKYMWVYRLVVKENKILHKDDMEDATKYFKRKGLYLDAAKIPEARGDKRLAKEIYTEGVKFYQEKGDNENAARAAMGAESPASEVREIVAKTKNVELIQQYMDYCAGIRMPSKQRA